MSDTKNLIRAGAILLPKTTLPEDLLSDDVVAREWHHPAFDAPVVRLETSNMLSGVDLEMDLLGFEEPGDLGVVGKRLRRKLGFPGWALVHEPQHAKYALDVVKELRKGAGKIKSKPGAGKEIIDGIGLKLAAKVPQFLPSFFEEAARIFLSYENYTYGAQYFEKARDAERVYALEVDEELREQSFVDFALARALSIKSLTNFGQEMIDKGEAEEGYHAYFRIAVRRTRGGLPPSPTMAKDLKKLAKAAGLNPDEEAKTFIRALLESPTLRMAADGFWKAYKKAIAALAKEDPSARSAILDLFPKTHPRKWFEILDACDATIALFDENVEPDARSKFTTADWFSKILKQQNDLGWWRKGDDTAERIFSLLISCAPRLREDGIPIALSVDRLGVDPDIVELGLSLEVEFSLTEEVVFTNLQSVGKYEKNEGRGMDWAFISKSPVFRALALKCIENSVYRMGDWIELIPTRPHLKEIVGEWLEGRIEKTEGKGALIDSYVTITQFTNMPKLLWREFPEHLARLLKTNVAIQLRKTLEIGTLDELCWPDLDDARANFSKPEEIMISGFYPFLVVYDETKFFVIGPEGPVLDGEIPKHKGYPIDEIIYSKNTVLMIFKKTWGEWKAQWFGGPVINVEDVPNYRQQSFVLPDGRVMFDGHRVLTPGDQNFKYDHRKSVKIVSDGKGYWKGLDAYEGRKKYIKYDPLSTKRIPNEDVPFLVEGEKHFMGDLRELVPMSEGAPIKTKDGLFGMRWERVDSKLICEDNMGVRSEGDSIVTCFVYMPGSDVPRYLCEAYRGHRLENEEGLCSVNEHKRFNRGGFQYLNAYFFTFFRPRDLETSKTLRSISLKDCETLLASGENEDAFVGAVSEMFPSADDKLVRGIAGLVFLAFEQIELLKNFNASVSDTSKLVYKDDPENFKVAFDGLMAFEYQQPRLLSRLEDLSKRLVEQKYFKNFSSSNADWIGCIGRSGAVAIRYANEVDAELRGTLARFLKLMSLSPFVGEELNKFSLFDVPQRDEDSNYPVWRKESYNSELQPVGDNVVYSRERGWRNFSGFEISEGGIFQIPTKGKAGSGWGNPVELDAFFELYEKNGPLPVNEILEDFCEACGLSEVEGWLALTNWTRDVSGKAKVSVIKTTKDVFNAQSRSEVEFFGLLFDSGPMEDLWDVDAFKKRAISTWLDGMPKLPNVSIETTLAFKKVAKETSAFVLREVSDPAISRTLNEDREWSWQKNYVGSEEGFSDPTPYVEALDFILHQTPRGSALFENYGKVWRAIRERTSHENYLFQIFHTWEAESEPFKSLIEMLPIDSKLSKTNIDGFQVAKKDGIYCSFKGYTAYCYMHASALEMDSPLLAIFGAQHEGGASNMEFIFSDFVDELIEISERTDIPDGEYHCNPKYCVPDLVSEITKKFGFDEDAAMLYLQILSLPYPTDANVRTWNGWKKAQHDKAIKALLDAELVVEAKRARAGRKIFVPGFWEVHKARIPTEAWKFLQLEWVDDDGEWFPNRPFPSCILSAPCMLFRDAWDRVKDGDGPKFGS